MNRFLDKSNAPMTAFFDVIYKLFILNLLFVLFTLMGLIIFGFYPSLLALYKLMKRTFFDKEEPIRYFSEYYELFKKNLLKGNILFVFSVVIGGITVLDLIFLFNNYLSVDELTVFGLIISMGGLLLSFLVFGLILYIPIVNSFYDRFSIPEILRFSFFTVLSAPILTFLFLLTGGLGYLTFSVLISATPFIGVSLPVYIFTLFYIKKFRQIFLIKKHDGYHYMSFRFISDKSKFIDILNSILGDVRDYIKNDYFIEILQQDDILFSDSVVVLDSFQEVVGMMLIRGHKNEKEIELIAVKKGFEKQGIGKSMLQILTEKKDGSKITCSTNKAQYHESFKYLPILKHFIKKNGFIKYKEDLYQLVP